MLKGEWCGMNNLETLKSLSIDELAKFLEEFEPCKLCHYYIEGLDTCTTERDFLCTKDYVRELIRGWFLTENDGEINIEKLW